MDEPTAKNVEHAEAENARRAEPKPVWMIQQPSIGRIVLYRSAHSSGEQAAIVTGLNPDDATKIDIMTFPPRGTPVPKRDVVFNDNLHTPLRPNDATAFWRWPPRS